MESSDSSIFDDSPILPYEINPTLPTDTTLTVIESSDDASSDGTSASESPIVFSDCPASPEPKEEDVYECESECKIVYSDIDSD